MREAALPRPSASSLVRPEEQSSQLGQSEVPSPPDGASSNTRVRKRIVLAVVGALVVGGALVAWFATRGGDQKIRVDYTLEVVTDDSCAAFSSTGYSDIPYAGAELYDGSGNLLGFGSLDGGTDLSDSCTFFASFEADRASDGIYRITAGNENRGFLNYGSSDVVNGVLTVSAVLD